MKKKLFALLQTLGLADKVNTGGLSAEEITRINAECKKQLNMTFEEAIIEAGKDEQETVTLKEEHKNILAAIFGTADETTEENVEETEEIQANEKPDPVKAVKNLKNTVKAQAKKIEVLEKEPEDSKPKNVSGKVVVIPVTGGAHTTKYLFGIEAPLFDMTKPWNAVAATRRPLEVIAADRGLASDWEEYEADFKKEVNGYGKSLALRMAQLQAENKLATIKMQDIDFSGFTDSKWGEEYIVRRQDALIAYIRTKNTLTGIFTTRYGVQNKEVLSNSFLTSFSQSYQGGRVFKGGVAVEPIEAKVFDLMFKHKFSNLKALEKEYIGYLNKEGSDPMKWTWIEWVLARILEVLMNEWNERRIIGVRVEPTKDKAGHYLHGSDGIIRKLRKYAYEEFRIQPISSIGVYTKTTILTTFEAFAEFVSNKIPSLKGYKFYYNEKHRPWYLAAYRKEYGLQQDFTGGKLSIMNYPDLEMVAVPNMGNLCFMFITLDGNIELLENQAGEMSKIGMQRDLEELMVFSYWKEGVEGYMVGKKFADATKLAADDYQNQYIFMNDCQVELAADATTCDATKGDWFKTGANTAAPTITDITSAVAGVVYRITCGSATNPSKTAKANKFSNVDAWVPTAVGDYLEVYLYNNLDDSTDALNGKFVEVGRKVTA